MRALEKIRIRGDVFNNTLNYSLVKDPKFARFYLLSKIHKRFLNVPGRPVISNCWFTEENISSFLDLHLQPIAQIFIYNLLVFILTSYMKKAFPHLEVPRCNDGKKVTTETLLELAEIVFSNNMFQFNESRYRNWHYVCTHPMQLYLLGLTLRKGFQKILKWSHAYGGGISMIYVSSGNM